MGKVTWFPTGWLEAFTFEWIGAFNDTIGYLGYIIPFAGFIAPLVMWLIKKDESAYIDAHGKVVFNWIISAFIWGIIGFILVFIGIGILILIALAICHIVFAIVGAIRANDGVIQNYPLTIKFFNV